MLVEACEIRLYEPRQFKRFKRANEVRPVYLQLSENFEKNRSLKPRIEAMKDTTNTHHEQECQ